MNKAFKVGDVVEWASQSGGHTKTKRGVVLFAHDNAGHVRPIDVWKAHFQKHKRMFDGWSFEQDGILVEVCDGKTSRAAPKLYMPRVARVRKVEKPDE